MYGKIIGLSSRLESVSLLGLIETFWVNKLASAVIELVKMAGLKEDICLPMRISL